MQKCKKITKAKTSKKKDKQVARDESKEGFFFFFVRFSFYYFFFFVILQFCHEKFSLETILEKSLQMMGMGIIGHARQIGSLRALKSFAEEVTNNPFFLKPGSLLLGPRCYFYMDQFSI